jgi:hypothetical protein
MRLVNGNYGLLFRQDGSNFFMLPTNSGDQYGSWNSLRPFYFSMTSGVVTTEAGALTIAEPATTDTALVSTASLDFNTYKYIAGNYGWTSYARASVKAINNSAPTLAWGDYGTSLAFYVNNVGGYDGGPGSFYSGPPHRPSGPTQNLVEAMRISSTGNVGIGTNNPTDKLYIDNVGTGQGVTVKGSSPSFRLADTSNRTVTFGLASANSHYSGSSVAGDLVISTGQERILVSAGGSNGVFLPNNAQGWSTYSDRRLKTDIEPIADSLNKVLQINGYTYHFKNDPIGSPLKVGVIAQELRAVLPEAVNEDARGILGVEYTAIIPLLINSFKELYQTWKSDSSEVHNELIAKDRRIQSLESTVKALCRHFPDDAECAAR